MKKIIAAAITPFLFVAACGDDGHNHTTTDTTTTDTATSMDTETPSDTAVAPDITEPEGRKAATASGNTVGWVRGFDGPMASGATTEVQVSLRDASGAAATGLTPTVTFIHVSMGHGGARSPFIDEGADGEYTVEDLQATMTGTWELKLDFGGGESISWTVGVQ